MMTIPRIPIEIFTPGQRLSGLLETRFHRVADALNDKGETFVIVHRVELTQLFGSLTQVQRLPMMKLNKRAICFAVPHEDDGDDPLRRQKRLYAYTPKDARPVYVGLDSYEIRGDIHVARTGTAPLALDIFDLSGDFVPVTTASVIFLLNPRIAFQTPVVIVNKAQVALSGMPTPVSAPAQA